MVISCRYTIFTDPNIEGLIHSMSLISGPGTSGDLPFFKLRTAPLLML
jgi:hypothetical protein